MSAVPGKPERGREHRREITAAVAAFHKLHGYGPSIRDVAEMVGVTPSTASYHIGLLVRAGVLCQDAGVARSLRGRPSTAP